MLIEALEGIDADEVLGVALKTTTGHAGTIADVPGGELAFELCRTAVKSYGIVIWNCQVP